jgi:hypothetical protein
MINEIEQIGMVCFVEGILMATTVCRNRTFMESLKHLSIHPRGFIFFLWGQGKGVGWNFYVPQVFNGFLMMFPNSKDGKVPSSEHNIFPFFYIVRRKGLGASSPFPSTRGEKAIAIWSLNKKLT